MFYKIACGDYETMKTIAERGFRALNPKTHKWQVVDRKAKYKVLPDGIAYTLFSDKDLRKIADEKGLIC